MIILNILPLIFCHHHYHTHVHPLHHHPNWTISVAFPAGEVVRSAGGLHQASAFGAQGDADGGGYRGGVCALLAAVLHHQHGQSGGHHPRVQRHCRHLLLCCHPVLCQLLCQPGPLRLSVGQLQTELQKSRLKLLGV